MKNIKSFIYIGLIIFLISFSCGCGNDEPVRVNLSVCETQWSELGSSTDDPIVYTQLKRGDIVYDSHETKIVVKTVTENRLVLEIDGYMVEPNDDGSVNLNAEPVKTIELTKGQSIELDSQTMSSGFNLLISYE